MARRSTSVSAHSSAPSSTWTRTPSPPSFRDPVHHSSAPSSTWTRTPSPPSFGDPVHHSSAPPSTWTRTPSPPSFGDPVYRFAPPSFGDPVDPVDPVDPFDRPSTPPSFGDPVHRFATPPSPPSFGDSVDPVDRLSTPPSFRGHTDYPSTPSSFEEPTLRPSTLPLSSGQRFYSSPSSSPSLICQPLRHYSFHKPALGSASVSAASPRRLRHSHICACPSRNLGRASSKSGYKTLPMALGVRGVTTPQSDQMVPQIEDYWVEILTNTNEAMLRLTSDLDYSQAAATYGSQMEGLATSRRRLNHALECMAAQAVNLQSLVRDLSV